VDGVDELVKGLATGRAKVAAELDAQGAAKTQMAAALGKLDGVVTALVNQHLGVSDFPRDDKTYGFGAVEKDTSLPSQRSKTAMEHLRGAKLTFPPALGKELAAAAAELVQTLTAKTGAGEALWRATATKGPRFGTESAFRESNLKMIQNALTDLQAAAAPGFGVADPQRAFAAAATLLFAVRDLKAEVDH
jgi:hypothetical protein